MLSAMNHEFIYRNIQDLLWNNMKDSITEKYAVLEVRKKKNTGALAYLSFIRRPSDNAEAWV